MRQIGLEAVGDSVEGVLGAAEPHRLRRALLLEPPGRAGSRAAPDWAARRGRPAAMGPADAVFLARRSQHLRGSAAAAPARRCAERRHAGGGQMGDLEHSRERRIRDGHGEHDGPRGLGSGRRRGDGNEPHGEVRVGRHGVVGDHPDFQRRAVDGGVADLAPVDRGRRGIVQHAREPQGARCGVPSILIAVMPRRGNDRLGYRDGRFVRDRHGQTVRTRHAHGAWRGRPPRRRSQNDGGRAGPPGAGGAAGAGAACTRVFRPVARPVPCESATPSAPRHPGGRADRGYAAPGPAPAAAARRRGTSSSHTWRGNRPAGARWAPDAPASERPRADPRRTRRRGPGCRSW